MNDCHARARAPRAARRPLSTIHHGITRVDDYAWLRAANWQAVMRDPAQLDPAIRAHLEAENGYAKALMADTEELQAQLFAEMKGRIKEDDASVPAPRWRIRLLHTLRDRRPASVILPQAA
jgi:oligopeptidase B